MESSPFDIISFLIKLAHDILDFYPALIAWCKWAIGWIMGLSLPLSLALLIGIVYCVENLKRIRNKEAEMLDLKVETAYETTIPSTNDHGLAKRWESVKQHANSANPNDWKQAILEADIILDIMLTNLGYRGESVGEKLKRVEASDFDSLNDAWEAHKVRNLIAHEGSGFALNEVEAKRTIAMYRKVFEEFHYVEKV